MYAKKDGNGPPSANQVASKDERSQFEGDGKIKMCLLATAAGDRRVGIHVYVYVRV